MSRNRRRIALLVAVLTTLLPVSPFGIAARAGTADVGVGTPALESSAAFLENAGQVERSDVRYYATSGGATFGFAPASVLVNLADEDGAGHFVQVRFEGAHPVEPVGRGGLPHPTSFFLGADPSSWRPGVRSYREIVYPNLYDGIDLVYRMDVRGAKYEFTVGPGADATRIRIAYEGVASIGLSPTGDLVLRTSLGELRDTKPIASQDGIPIPCAFTRHQGHSIGISCPMRDPSRTLVIDPLVYATFLGGGDFDEATAIAVDSSGNAYVTGLTRSPNFPATAGAYNTTHNAGDDVFVAKLSPSGTSLSYATYIGGAGTDLALGIAISGGSAYITGQTDSSDFPTTAGAMDRQNNATDAFVVKLSPAGDSLVYSTFLGGNVPDIGYSIDVDPSGSAYVTGITGATDFPTTPGAMNTSFNGGLFDLFLVKVNPVGSALDFGTYFGGSQPLGNIEIAFDLAVDGSGSAFVVGITNALDFPTTIGAFNQTLNGPTDAFVAKFQPDGSGLLFSTYLGGSSGEAARTVAIDTGGHAYVAGNTDSFDFPVTPGAFNTSYGGTTDAFAAKLTPAGDALAYATFLGGPNEDVANGIGIDAAGRATIGGYTNSTTFPTTPGASNTTFLGGVYDGYVARLDASGGRLVYGTFLGGARTDSPYALAIDSAGDAYVAGITNSTNFPVTAGAYNSTFSGGLFDAFVAKLSLAVPLALDTSPSGLQVEVDGAPVTTPYTLLCDPDRTVTVNAPTPQTASRTRWDFLSWSDAGAQSHAVACTVPTSLTANFVATEYEKTVDTAPPTLFVLFDGALQTAPHVFWCIAGSTHTISVPTPQVAGSVRYTFVSWSDGGPRLHGIPCTAPATYVASFTTEYEVNVTTSPVGRQIIVNGSTLTAPQSFWWAAGSAHTLDVPSPQAAGTTQYLFAAWSDGGAQAHSVTATGPITHTATFSLQYETTVTSLPVGLQVVVDGNSSISPITFWCDAGSSHGLDAPSPQGSGPIRNVFASWSDGGAQSHSITCDAPRTVAANFGTEYEMRLDTLPAGLGLELDGGPVTAPHTFWCTASAGRTVSAPTPQVAGPTRHSFLSWSDGGARTHSVPCDQPSTFTALFITEHQVTIGTTPLDLDVTVDGTLVRAPVIVWWADGSTHTVAIATPQYPGGPVATRYAFLRWSDGLTATSRFITVNGPATLTAEFRAEHPILLDTSPAGRSVRVDGISYPTPQTLWWVNGTTHLLEVATPQARAAGVQYAFASWSDGGAVSRMITASAPLALTATFTTQYFLSLTSPRGTPWCDNADCWYDEGVTAAFGVNTPVDGAPGVRYTFSFWSGDVNSATPVVPILMDSPKSETAEWTTEYFLSIVSLYGNVTGERWYAAGSTATFSVTAREVTVGGTRYRFVRWTGSVNSTATSGTIQMDGPETIVAQWEALAFFDPAQWVIFLPILVAVVVAALLWRRRKKREPKEVPRPKTAEEKAREKADDALADLEDELDLDARPKR